MIKQTPLFDGKFHLSHDHGGFVVHPPKTCLVSCGALISSPRNSMSRGVVGRSTVRYSQPAHDRLPAQEPLGRGPNNDTGTSAILTDLQREAAVQHRIDGTPGFPIHPRRTPRHRCPAACTRSRKTTASSTKTNPATPASQSHTRPRVFQTTRRRAKGGAVPGAIQRPSERIRPALGEPRQRPKRLCRRLSQRMATRPLS